MPEKSIKRPINFPPEVLKTLDRLAAKEHTTTSELVRRFVEKGLAVDGHKEVVEFIAGIIRQELLVVYHIEDIKAVVEQQANRIVKMHMKNCDRRRCLLRRWGGGEFAECISDAVARTIFNNYIDYVQDFKINGSTQTKSHNF